MAVSNFERDWLRLFHIGDQLENILNGLEAEQLDVQDKKQQVGSIVRYLEEELLDDKWAQAGKDVATLAAIAAAGRVYWKSTD